MGHSGLVLTADPATVTAQPLLPRMVATMVTREPTKITLIPQDITGPEGVLIAVTSMGNRSVLATAVVIRGTMIEVITVSFNNI